MTPAVFRNLLIKAGFRSQREAAEFLEISERTMRRYLAGPGAVPKAVVWAVLRFMERKENK